MEVEVCAVENIGHLVEVVMVELVGIFIHASPEFNLVLQPMFLLNKILLVYFISGCLGLSASYIDAPT